ncbi:MAG: site-specific integrase [Terriglobales bacterium]
MQRGQLIQASGTIYIRFYRDGKRVAEKLCAVDDVHYGPKSKAVKRLAAEFMLKLARVEGPKPAQALVSDFWTAEFLPYCERKLKPSSVHGYKKLWSGVLEKHFEGRTLQGYKTHHGSEFLTSLAPRLSRNSLSHVRGLASSIFSIAVNRGAIERNPWREVRVMDNPKQSKPTAHYTLDEATAAIEKLTGRETVAFGLSFFLALRPGELCGLRWEDFDAESVLIRRSVWRKHVGTTKMGTEQRVPVIEQARGLLDSWRIECGNPSEGWVFKGPSGPLAPAALTRPMQKALGDSWKPLYSARRGMSTTLTELTGTPFAAKGLLRHRSASTTLGFYTKAMPAETLRGVRMLERLSKENGQESEASSSDPAKK